MNGEQFTQLVSILSNYPPRDNVQNPVDWTFSCLPEINKTTTRASLTKELLDYAYSEWDSNTSERIPLPSCVCEWAEGEDDTEEDFVITIRWDPRVGLTIGNTFIQLLGPKRWYKEEPTQEDIQEAKIELKKVLYEERSYIYNLQ